MEAAMVKLTDDSENRIADLVTQRRRFLTCVLTGGITAAIVHPVQAATSSEDTCLLPTSADSLTLYLASLDEIRGLILRPYTSAVGQIALDLRARYESLKRQVEELETEVPQLREGTGVSRVKDVTEAGRASARYVAQGGTVIAAHVALITYATNSLSDSASSWQMQQGSLTLTPRAVEILRAILREIRLLATPTQNLEQASNALNQAFIEVNQKLDDVKRQVLQAITGLASVELVGSPNAGERRQEAIQLIQSAINNLRQLDTYTPPVNVPPINTTQLPRVSATSQPNQNEPTKLTRELLAGTIALIQRDAPATSYERRIPRSEMSFVPVSTSAPIAAAGLYFEVRQVLSEILRQPLRLRTWSCIALISPILAGYSNPKRFELIYSVIPYMFPRGESDFVDSSRRAAAQRLANLNL